MVREKEEKEQTDLTDYEIGAMYINSIAVFAEVSSKVDIEKGMVFHYGRKLFDEAIASIKEVRNKLSEKT